METERLDVNQNLECCENDGGMESSAEENSSGEETSSSSSETDEYNRLLHDRILGLRETIHSLKGQLQEEREIWQREIGDAKQPQSVLGGGYDYLDYELQRYQDVIMQSHYENRQVLQKQIAFANYKRRLLEVENMCNLELLRVKQSVQILQPLQMMASEWGNGDDCNGDLNKKKSSETAVKAEEVSMPLETFAIYNSNWHQAAVSEQHLKETNLSDFEKHSQSQPSFTENYAQ